MNAGDARPDAVTEPAHGFSFTFAGGSVRAAPGQSIGAALYADGQRIFSRSFKYHRPRGLLCVAGDCPNCLMEVDGRPNVRVCVEPARPGQTVRHQHAWPSLEFDALRLFDRLDRLLPVGFYYKRFHKPRWLWPLFERIVRPLAGNGRVDVTCGPARDVAVEHLFADVCVIGSGPAGLSAADTAAEGGARVLLLERLPGPGGHLLYERDSTAIHVSPKATLLTETTAFGLYEGNLVAAVQHDRLLKIRARHVIVCTGGRERPFVFHNNDLPGIFLGRGAERLFRLYGVLPGMRAVIVGDPTRADRLARSLAGAGMEIAGVADVGANTLLAARGDAYLQAVDVADVDAAGSVIPHTRRRLEADLLCMASPLFPANELLLQAGLRFQFQQGGWRPAGTVAGVSCAGAVAGTFDLELQQLEGRLRGAEAAEDLAFAVPNLNDLRAAWEARAQTCSAGAERGLLLPAQATGRKRFVCLCEDVTQKDLEQAVAEGFDEIETLKRYSTATMGPCQGKVCGQAASEVCALATGRDVAQVGTTTSRPPATPVELGVLAAGAFHPVRRTPMHHWHETHGATWLDAGLWKRPERYGDPAAEVSAVRTRVGLIDVSTLGKIELLGPDAAELLQRVYLNRWTDLPIGSARYGIMCNEDGILFDDGVGARLGTDRFYLTTTTGNAEGVLGWLELWRDTWGLDVTILNQTSGCAAMNLAGPHARAVLRQLTTLDLSPSAFRYLTFREADVAGAPCRLFRIGFVGELGYEIHCPALFGLHVWEALFEAGREFGIRPCGIEAQRILRLEKGHLIIGVDTDALSTPLEANLERLIDFAKPRFHGREPLLRLRARGPRSRLVGFATEARRFVPDEGCQVVEGGRPVGRVTSVRYSPTLEKSIGLAWVPAAAATIGNRFLIRWHGSDQAAIIQRLPFYDPRGRRLRG